MFACAATPLPSLPACAQRTCTDTPPNIVPARKNIRNALRGGFLVFLLFVMCLLYCVCRVCVVGLSRPRYEPVIPSHLEENTAALTHRLNQHPLLPQIHLAAAFPIQSVDILASNDHGYPVSCFVLLDTQEADVLDLRLSIVEGVYSGSEDRLRPLMGPGHVLRCSPFAMRDEQGRHQHASLLELPVCHCHLGFQIRRSFRLGVSLHQLH
jgi:hypothetical protein